MQIVQDNATTTAGLGVGFAEAGAAARSAFADYKVIRRNGAVVGFEPAKVSVAMTKAFLAVNGAQGAASARVRELVQFVPIDRRAWHAGESRWRGRARCNDFSIGVELEGTDEAPFDARQYGTLASLIAALRARLPLRAIAAHSDIAPGRKTDPGPGFDWPRLLAELAAR